VATAPTALGASSGPYPMPAFAILIEGTRVYGNAFIAVLPRFAFRSEEPGQMNLLWLTHAIPYPPKAGFLSRTYNLLREVGRRHEVDLISFIQEPWIRTHFPTVEEGIEESRRALGSICRRVTFLPIDRMRLRWGKHITALNALLTGKTYTATWLVSASARRVIAEEMLRNRYDLVHFDTIGLAPYRDLTTRVPAILTHHNIESHMMMRRADNEMNTVARAYFRLEARRLEAFERRIAPAYAAHITCSELDTGRLRRIVKGASVVTIPNGVDCDFFNAEHARTRPNSAVFVGTMNWYPNIDAMQFFLREIWPQLRARVPDATMDIAGSNPPEDLIRLARSLPGVTVHGYLPDVRPLIDSAAVFVCPIRDGGGTKLKILDAFAMKKCVVAHPIACEGIDVTAGRDVVLASTSEEFVSQISRLFANERERVDIGTAARELVEKHYSFRQLGERLASTIEDVVQRHETQR
jgi:sugar transferase (PEP-CTERM/EpsH1 system associated)